MDRDKDPEMSQIVEILFSATESLLRYVVLLPKIVLLKYSLRCHFFSVSLEERSYQRIHRGGAFAAEIWQNSQENS